MAQYLQRGDKVSLISPAAVANEAAVKIIVKQLTLSGLIPIYHQNMNVPLNAPYQNLYEQMQYAGSDTERLGGFQAAIDNDSKALWVLHGGQGCEKIVAALERGDIILPENKKKWIIGFSGVTNLHLYFQAKDWPCLHGPVASIAKDTFELTHCPINTQASLTKVIDTLTGENELLSYSILPINNSAKQNNNIISDTSVVGGCLNILITHQGTPTALQARNKIVFIEDEPQRPERIETMLLGLIRSRTFHGAKAIIIGSLSDPQFNGDRFKSVKPILLERITAMFSENAIDVPIYHADNFGHGDFNDPLPLGTTASIKPGDPAILTVKTRNDIITLSF